MNGGVVEQDVILDVEGQQIARAFDAIDARVAKIEGKLGALAKLASAAGHQFGSGLDLSMRSLNQVFSRMEQFEKNMAKLDPNVRKAEEINRAYVQQGKVRKDIAQQAYETEKAYANRSVADEEKKQRDLNRMALAADRERYNSREGMQKRYEKLGEASTQRMNQQELAADRERDRQRVQNRYKNSRELMRADLETSRDARKLENERIVAAERLTRARALLGKVDADEERQLHQIIALERERQDLASRRLKAIAAPASDGRIDHGLNVRTAKADEESLIAARGLRDAKMRQAELEARIAAQVERTRLLTGQEKIDAERVLKVEEARLAVVNRRVAALDREQRKMVQSAQPKPGAYGPPVPPGFKPPSAGGGGPRKPGLFGATGLGGIFLRTAAYGGAAAALYGTISLLREGVGAAIEFEDALAKIQAVAGLTDTQTTKLGASIRQVASNSRFATQEIAESTMVMAQAGFSASDIGDALQHVADLAAASGSSMKESTDIVTSAIGAFQLQTSETGHIADVLSAALNDTKLNIQQVALGIQYAGQTAYENKISFDELTASMATMAQAGIRSGSTMGTGMRLFLTDLMSPTKKLGKELDRLGLTMNDIDVKTLGLPEVLHRLSAAGFSASSAYGALEKRSAAAYLVLKNNQDILNQTIISENRVGAAADAAAKAQGSFTAEWQRFKNIVSEDSASVFSPILDGLRDLLHGYNELAKDKAYRAIVERGREAFFAGDGQAWLQAFDAANDYRDALAEVIDLENFNQTAIEKSNTALNEATDKFNQTEQSVRSSTDAIARLVQRQGSLQDGSTALAAETASLTSRFSELAGQLVGTTNTYLNLLNAMQAVRQLQIQMGATEAGKRYMAADQHARDVDVKKTQLAQSIMNSGATSKMPEDVWGAFGRLILNPDGATSQNDSALVYEYGKKVGGLIGRKLTDFVQTATEVGASIYTANQAKLDRDKFRALGSETGQKVFAEVDASQGKSDGYIKKLVAKYRKNSVDPRYSKAEQAAWDYLAQIEESKLGTGAPPHVAEGSSKGRKLHPERTLLREQLKADEAQLKQSVKGLLDTGGTTKSLPDGTQIVVRNKTLTHAQFEKNLERVQAALDQWVDDRTKQVEEQIEDQKMSPKQAQLMREALSREIAAKREEAGRDVAKKITEALDIIVDAVNQTADAAKAAADQQVALAQARVQSLSRSNMEGRVPDYVQQTFERKAAQAADERDKAYVAIQAHQIEQLKAALNDAEKQLADAEAKGFTDKANDTSKHIDELKIQILNLTYANEALKASFGGDGLIPQSFNDQLSMAIENYRKVNNLTASFSEMVGMNLTDAIGTAHQSLEQFLNDATSGTMTVQQAWGSMVKNIIGYLKQLLVKMIAVKLMEMALGLFGGSSAAPAAAAADYGSGAAGMSGMIGPPTFNGGEARAKGAFFGRHIQAGYPGRDSVNMRVAKGEYIVRKSAVDSVGVDFMRRLNERGAAALSSLMPKIVMPPPSQQMMNVYVVAPNHQPTMGPNDVLVTIANDIYEGGQTKQLIKQVAQGA